MNKTFSPARSQKTSSGITSAIGGSTPFDQITQLEAQEKERVQKEIAAMEVERGEVEKAVNEKTFQAEEDLKLKAGEELKDYRENELSEILTAAKDEAEKNIRKLEEHCKAKEKSATQLLVQKMIQDDSHLFQ